VPIRWLIGPGLLIVGGGLLLMRGLDANSSWTHLIPGLVLSGAGAGLVNPPLASTAVGVVRPERAGMASGINSTFRQVGIATGIALLGTLFASKLRDSVAGTVQAHPVGVPARAISSALQNGQAGTMFKHAAGTGNAAAQHKEQTLQFIARTGFTTALDHILLVAAIIAIVCGVLSFFLIRQKDFVHYSASEPPAMG
jgi:hypothetical protein